MCVLWGRHLYLSNDGALLPSLFNKPLSTRTTSTSTTILSSVNQSVFSSYYGLYMVLQNKLVEIAGAGLLQARWSSIKHWKQINKNQSYVKQHFSFFVNKTSKNRELTIFKYKISPSGNAVNKRVDRPACYAAVDLHRFVLQWCSQSSQEWDV